MACVQRAPVTSSTARLEPGWPRETAAPQQPCAHVQLDGIGEYWEREQEDLEGERWKFSEIGNIERLHGDGNNRRERENE